MKTSGLEPGIVVGIYYDCISETVLEFRATLVRQIGEGRKMADDRELQLWDVIRVGQTEVSRRKVMTPKQ